MTDEEANAIETRHLVQNPLPHANYRWRLSVGREFGDGWYFVSVRRAASISSRGRSPGNAWTGT